MEELTRNLELMEVISATDAMNNAWVELEDAAEDMDPDRWEGIRRHLFPVLEAEGRHDHRTTHPGQRRARRQGARARGPAGAVRGL